MAYAARVMRSLIIDHVRNRRARKRGGLFEITALETTVADQVGQRAGAAAHQRRARRAGAGGRDAGGGRGPEVLLRVLVRRDRGDARTSRSARFSGTGRRRACTCTARSATSRRWSVMASLSGERWLALSPLPRRGAGPGRRRARAVAGEHPARATRAGRGPRSGCSPGTTALDRDRFLEGGGGRHLRIRRSRACAVGAYTLRVAARARRHGHGVAGRAQRRALHAQGGGEAAERRAHRRERRGAVPPRRAASWPGSPIRTSPT